MTLSWGDMPAFRAENAALYKRGAVIAKDDTASALCAAAFAGSLAELRQNLAGKAAVNFGDYMAAAVRSINVR